MRLQALSLAMLLALSGGLLLLPGYLHANESMGQAPAAPAPAQPPPPRVAPPPVKMVPPRVPSRNAVLRAKMIAEIKTKYAQQKSFVTAKYIEERTRLNNIAAMCYDDPPTQAQVLAKIKLLDMIYRKAISDLNYRRDAEIRGVYAARDLLR